MPRPHTPLRCNPLQCLEVMNLSENDFRKWMVILAAATLIVTVIRLWIGV
jgi:hypothetical protein